MEKYLETPNHSHPQNFRNFWDIKAPKTEKTDNVRVAQQFFYDYLNKLVKDIVNVTLNGPGHSFGVYFEEK